MKMFLISLVLLIASSGLTVLFLTHPISIQPKLPEVTKQNKTTPTPTPFSIEKPPTQALSGNVLSLTGDTLWQSRSATEPAKITSLEHIQQGESIQTKKTGEVSLSISDLQIIISPQTSLDFLQLLRTSFVLAQHKGTVEYQNNQTNQLSIRSLHSLIKPAQNSQVSVSVDDEEDTLEVSVSSGSATIAFNDSDNLSTVITIPEGKALDYDDTSRTTSLSKL